MNSLDIILTLPVVIGFIIGLFKGLIKEIASLLSVLVAIFAAKYISVAVAAFLIHAFGFTDTVAHPVAYIIVFVAIIIGFIVLSRFFEKILEEISLGGINKLLGGVFGGLKYALIVSILLTVFDTLDERFHFVKPETKSNSLFFKPITSLAPTLWDQLKHENQKTRHEEEEN